MIYFARIGPSGPVKIGYAVDAEQRRRQMQASHVEGIELLRIAPGNRHHEKWLHRFFASQHIRGELYAFSNEMLTVELPEIHEIDAAEERANGLAGGHAVIERLEEGDSQAAIARTLGLSRQRVNQIVGRHRRLMGTGASPTSNSGEPNAVADAIEALGGAGALAVNVGVVPSAVRNWRRLNAFPPRLYLCLTEIAQKRGFMLDRTLFREMSGTDRRHDAAVPRGTDP